MLLLIFLRLVKLLCLSLLLLGFRHSIEHKQIFHSISELFLHNPIIYNIFLKIISIMSMACFIFYLYSEKINNNYAIYGVFGAFLSMVKTNISRVIHYIGVSFVVGNSVAHSYYTHNLIVIPSIIFGLSALFCFLCLIETIMSKRAALLVEYLLIAFIIICI